MRNRFSLPRPPVGDKLLANASSLKIELLRTCDGDLWADYTIAGSLAIEEESNSDAIRFARQLLAEFARPREGGEHAT